MKFLILLLVFSYSLISLGQNGHPLPVAAILEEGIDLPAISSTGSGDLTTYRAAAKKNSETYIKTLISSISKRSTMTTTPEFEKTTIDTYFKFLDRLESARGVNAAYNAGLISRYVWQQFYLFQLQSLTRGASELNDKVTVLTPSAKEPAINPEQFFKKDKSIFLQLNVQDQVVGVISLLLLILLVNFLLQKFITF